METRTNHSNSLRLELFDRPGLHMTEHALHNLVQALTDVAATCFTEVPDYQIMTGTREELSDKIIAVAWREDGTAAGFCSVVLLPISGYGNVLHLGLTCVRPDARGLRLTHRLIKKAVFNYLLRQNPFGKHWISNCAGVLSSLGNVAMYFEEVFPSPFYEAPPSTDHLAIAGAIEQEYRKKMYVPSEAVLDEDRFIFRQSVKGTVFEKSDTDLQYFHRQSYLNNYYRRLIDFQNGDEVLQVGYFRLISFLKYYFRQKKIVAFNRLETIPGHLTI